MRFSLQWLNEWIDVGDDTDDLAHKLAMAGFESEGLFSAGSTTKDTVVGVVHEFNVLAQDETLSKYQIRIKDNKIKNVLLPSGLLVVGQQIAFAPNDTILATAKVQAQEFHGVGTEGKVCTEADLGLSDRDDLVLFDNNIEIGSDVFSSLSLDDKILEFDITPNRGDCLSVMGFTRELSAILQKTAKRPELPRLVVVHHDEEYAVDVKEPIACPSFNTRVVFDVNNNVTSPIWLRERLRRCGIRSINPVVDIANYVMLELGQPMHVYDYDTLQGSLQVRFAKDQEKLKLIDENEVTLQKNTLVIADSAGAQAIAGVMGGIASSVTSSTRSIVLESAYFSPEIILGKARSYGLTTDSAFRFERGVCPSLQLEAIERFCTLLLEVTGGKFGPIKEAVAIEYIPQPKIIQFRKSKCEQLLGIEIDSNIIQKIFTRLGFTVIENSSHWDIRVPPHRFDICEEVDLTEEVARIYGYENIPAEPLYATLQKSDNNSLHSIERLLRNSLQVRGYNETINYSFVDPDVQAKMFDTTFAMNLLNPISPQLSQMRLSLLPGLLQVVKYNQHRQSDRVRLFELGQCFEKKTELLQKRKLGGVAFGDLFPLQWGKSKGAGDFFDIKKDVECILARFRSIEEFVFTRADVDFLHPGVGAKIEHDGNIIGFIGMLHPNITKALELKGEVYIFELDLELIPQHIANKYKNTSVYPALRRDISFYVDKNISVHELTHEIRKLSCSFLQNVSIFDIYEDKMQANLKSVALGLILQHQSRTLVEDEIVAFMEQVVDKLKKSFNIELRDE